MFDHEMWVMEMLGIIIVELFELHHASQNSLSIYESELSNVCMILFCMFITPCQGMHELERNLTMA